MFDLLRDYLELTLREILLASRKKLPLLRMDMLLKYTSKSEKLVF